MKIRSKQKNLKQGFTLLELLVVVLIIGILAGIALPQYKMAVAKSKYNSVKEMTESLAQAVERYYLATGTSPANLEVLDIDIPGEYTSNAKTRKTTTMGETCGFNDGDNQHLELICFTKIFGQRVAYRSTIYFNTSTREKACYALSSDITDFVNKFCQKDTGRKSPLYPCATSYYCLYRY